LSFVDGTDLVMLQIKVASYENNDLFMSLRVYMFTSLQNFGCLQV
jgi:hypothetical protein